MTDDIHRLRLETASVVLCASGLGSGIRLVYDEISTRRFGLVGSVRG